LTYFENLNKNLSRRTIGIPKKGLVVLYTGPLMVKKGIFQYARVISKLSYEFSDTHFVLIESRESHRYESIRNRSKLLSIFKGINNIFFFQGIFSRNDLYSAPDIVVVPQKDPHGTIIPPITILEAMAAGRAVIGTNTIGIKGLIQDGLNGVLYDKSNDEGLENAIRKLLLNKKLREKLGSNAKKYMKSRTISNTVSQYLELYQSS
jgi:glycosyltransferase involved in cell wall biosynthesis